MKTRYLFWGLFACSSVVAFGAAPLKTLAEFQKGAAAFHSEIRVPVFPTTPSQIEADKKSAIAGGDRALDQIARQDPGRSTFESTFGALDDLTYEAGLAAGR